MSRLYLQQLSGYFVESYGIILDHIIYVYGNAREAKKNNSKVFFNIVLVNIWSRSTCTMYASKALKLNLFYQQYALYFTNGWFHFQTHIQFERLIFFSLYFFYDRLKSFYLPTFINAQPMCNYFMFIIDEHFNKMIWYQVLLTWSFNSFRYSKFFTRFTCHAFLLQYSIIFKQENGKFWYQHPQEQRDIVILI